MKRTLFMLIFLSMNISMYGHLTMPQTKKVTTVSMMPRTKKIAAISMHLAALLAGSCTCYFKYAGKDGLSRYYLGGLLITYSLINLLEMYTPDKQSNEDQSKISA